MKKIISTISLTIALIANLNIYAYDNSQIDIIKNAIKDSRPKILKEVLDNIQLTEKDKNALLSMAISISNARENEMNIQLINPKERPISDGILYRLLALGLVASIPFAIVFSLVGFFTDVFDWDSSLEKPLAIAWTASACLACKKLYSIANKVDQEFLQKYRTEEQKYIDSLDIIAILKLH